MKENNVIQFPREKTMRIALSRKMIHQKGMLLLSIFSVLALSVVSNELVVSQQSIASSNRGIASLPGAAANAASVKWEQELARDLSKDKNRVVHLGVKPTLKDELIFGSLEGKYGMILANGRIESLEFIQGQETESPLLVRDRAAFLKRYHEAFSLDYSVVSLSESSPNLETWNLVASDKTIVGKASFKFDSDGRLLSLQFIQ